MEAEGQRNQDSQDGDIQQQGGVVDPQLRVYGVDGLRIAGANRYSDWWLWSHAFLVP